MAKNFEKLIFGGLHEKHAVQRSDRSKGARRNLSGRYREGNTCCPRRKSNPAFNPVASYCTGLHHMLRIINTSILACDDGITR
jgi:hypothetical protein